MAPSAISLCLFLCFMFFVPTLDAANVSLSSSLSATGDYSSWNSSSEEFAFGFFRLNNTDSFLLAIWYAKIPERTIVWHANTTGPVRRGSRVELRSTGLVLTDPDGHAVRIAEPNGTVSGGAMLDTGNFVLSGADSVRVWESFNNPTDTILPTQGLGLDRRLYSRLSPTNYSRGRFELSFSGDLVLYELGWPTANRYDSYYTSGSLNTTNPSESGVQLVFNESTNTIYVVKGNGGTFQLSWQNSAPIGRNTYYRATLDFDGVFREYAYLSGDGAGQSWLVVRYIPGNICLAITHRQQGSGACGFNSYCVIQNGTPSCHCPNGYSFMDPDNQFGGCKPDFPLGCDVDDGSIEPENLYEIRTISIINWPFGDYDSLAPYNQSQCQESCLHDCWCAVAIFDGTTCWKKKLPLANGRAESTIALVKVGKNPTPSCRATNPNPNTSTKKTENRILWGILASSALINAIFLVAISRFVLLKRNKRKSIQGSGAFESDLRAFSFKELNEATDGFKDELGRGSFGIVYKGILRFGSRNLQVAVKKLDKLSQDGEKEFRAEVNAIGKTHHKNLVQLLGYCDEGPHRILTYEYMSNGSLANYLFGSTKPGWDQRAQMALGIARGLVYLHEECYTPIIHCDIKPQNVLLDYNFTARISDFGLAKSLMFDQTRTCTGIRGTRGYVGPEWFKSVPVTVKVDVYSYGVMLLEIICCRKNVTMDSEEQERAILTDWVYDCYMEGRLDALLENSGAEMCGIEELHRWVATALWCIQDDPSRRPAMKLVTQTLEGSVELPALRPFLSMNSTF